MISSIQKPAKDNTSICLMSPGTKEKWTQSVIVKRGSLPKGRSSGVTKKRETQAVDKELVVSLSPCCDVPLLALPRIVLWRNRLSAPATYRLYKKPRGLSIKSSSQFCFRARWRRTFAYSYKRPANPPKMGFGLSNSALFF